MMLGDGADIFGHCLAFAERGGAELGGRGGELAAQVLQEPEPGAGHSEPAPAAGWAVQHGLDQGQAGVLAGEPAGDLDPREARGAAQHNKPGQCYPCSTGARSYSG